MIIKYDVKALEFLPVSNVTGLPDIAYSFSRVTPNQELTWSKEIPKLEDLAHEILKDYTGISPEPGYVFPMSGEGIKIIYRANQNHGDERGLTVIPEPSGDDHSNTAVDLDRYLTLEEYRLLGGFIYSKVSQTWDDKSKK